jgi:hypothetical protein
MEDLSLNWFFDHYRIGKRRQWVGAPIPVLLRLRESTFYRFLGIPPDPLWPVLEVHSEVKGRPFLRKFELKMQQPGFWTVELKTEELGPGKHDLVFYIGEEGMIHASDHPLLVLPPEEYRRELIEEAKEGFEPSLGIFDTRQLEHILRTTTAQRSHDSGWRPEGNVYIERKEGLGKLAAPIAIAPIRWILDALIGEFLYLSTLETNVKWHSWFISMQNETIRMGFELHFIDLPSEATQEAVSNKELSDLYLLGLGGDLPNYNAVTEFNNKMNAAKISVEYGTQGALAAAK